MRMITASLIALSAAGAALAAPTHAPAPRVAAKSFDQLAKPLPLPYDEQADATKAVAAAKAKARAEHKLLLIDLGGNWCLDCRILAGTMNLPQVHQFVDKHYVEVTVDIGRFDKNLGHPAALRHRQAGRRARRDRRRSAHRSRDQHRPRRSIGRRAIDEPTGACRLAGAVDLIAT